MILLFTSFSLTILLIVFFRWLFQRLHWLDQPHLFGYQRRAVPYGVGVVFFLTFFLLALIFLPVNPKLIALILASGIITLVSFIDDRLKLPTIPRLVVQILCALIVVLAGVSIPALSNPFGDPIVLDTLRFQVNLFGNLLTIAPLADLVAVTWIVFVMNAMNWLDGAPGMVSGITTIACAVLYLLATLTDLHVIDQSTLSVIALIIGGSTAAFLFFDFPRPYALMGDSGTMFLGFIIAVMAMFSGGKLATAFIVLAFPILDAAWTIVRRMLQKKSPFKGDFQHFHHELMGAGFSERQINLFYFTMAFGFGVSALFLETFGKLVAVTILFSLMVMIRILLLKRG